MRARISILIAVALMVLVFSPAAAFSSPRAHDGGFFLRLSAGGGYASSSLTYMGSELELSGGAVDYNFAVGGVVAPNLALHGTIWGWYTSDPTLKVDGTDVGALDVNFYMNAFGGGVTYYFMPVNIYLSGSLGAGRNTIESDGDEGKTDYGATFDITLGKEWWVGNSWGLGVAGAFGYHSFPDGDVDENWSGTSFTVRFTATMN